jgi:uncharacterized membrane protein
MSIRGLSARGLTPTRGLPALRPLQWLRRGAEDLRHSFRISLLYGLIVTAIGALILSLGNHPYYVDAAVTGFLLVGPVLGTGLCELSRRRERGEATGFEESLSPLTRNRDELLRFAFRLLMVGAVWFAVSTVLLQGIFAGRMPETTSVLWDDALAHASASQLFGYIATGGMLAVLVFALSIVAVPVLIARDGATADDAMGASLSACLHNLPAVIVWATLIALLVAVGFATMLIGMLVIFPLLGHATWHAYRDLYR